MNPPRDASHPLRHAGAGFLKLATVVAIISLGSYALFSGSPRSDRHAMEALDHNQILIGASLSEWPSDANDAIARFERQADLRLDVVDLFLDWYTPWRNVSHTVDHIVQHGAIPQLSWESHGFTTPDILDGSKQTPLRDGRRLTLDAYMNEFAKGLCGTAHAFQTVILLRVMHEFNGHWFSWGISHTDEQGRQPNTNETYRAAWIKIHNVFRDHCGDEIRFVWAVNHFSVGPGATFTGPYPGDAYVDYVGLDGYNWGTNAPWGWQSFDEIFTPSYCAVNRVTKKPILLSEVSSSEAGGSKASWIRDLFLRLAYRSYPGVLGVVWFNDAKYEVEIQGRMDWPIDSSAASLGAFRDGGNALLQQRDGSDPSPPTLTTIAGPRCQSTMESR